MQRKFYILLLGMVFCFLCFTRSADCAENRADRQREDEDPYRRELLDRFPEHRKIIVKLYDSYSGWIIDLSRKYGEAPLLAMGAAKESEYSVLFRYPDIFDDLYRTMTPVRSKSKRAYLALRLANAMLMRNPEEDYAEALERAKAEDEIASRQGKPSRRYVEAFFAKGMFPDNLLSALKKDPSQYEVLLNSISKADISVLEAFATYPNAGAFLLNTGVDGVKLLKETNGMVVALAYLLPDEEQARLPAQFKQYHRLAEAVASCGPEAFFVILTAPEFYFALASALSGKAEDPYFVAFSVMSRMFEDESDAVNDSKRSFLNALHREDAERLARLTAELLDGVNDSEDDAPLAIAPLFDPYFLQFVRKYDRAALDVCARFGDICAMGTLLMRDWRGDERDVSPVIEAILEYKELGLQAARTFQYNNLMQDIILDPVWGQRHRDLLMFLFYDPAMGLSAGMSDWNKIAAKLLLDYRPEQGTGKPIAVEKNGFIEFLPGHDFLKTTYDLVKFGKTPTVGDIIFSAFDLVDLVPIGIAAVALTKEIAQHGFVRISRYAMKFGEESIKTIPSFAGGKLDDIAQMLRKIKNVELSTLRRMGGSMIDDVAKTMGEAYGKLRKLDVWAIASTLGSDSQDLLKMYDRVNGLAKATGYKVIKLYADSRKYWNSLYSGPWMTKHSTEALIGGVTTGFVLQPTLSYGGVLSLQNYLDAHQLPLK